MITTIEYQKLLLFIGLLLNKSRLKGTIEAGDIANSIFIEHPKMALKGLKTFVKKAMNKEIANEQSSRLSAEALERKNETASHWLAYKKANDPEYAALCNQRNNDWEKNERKNNPAWKKRRNKTQRNKKRQQKKDRDNLLPPS